jgi:hypothetical protein
MASSSDRRRRGGALAALLLLLSSSFSREVFAEPPRAPPSPEVIRRAEEAYDAGTAALATGDLDLATKHLRSAYALVRTPIPGLALVKVLRDAKKWVEAVSIAEDVAAIPDYAGMTANGQRARAEAHELATSMAAQLPKVTVQLLAAKGDATVTLDGRALGPSELARPLKVDPGAHTISVTGGTSVPCTDGRITLDRSEARTLVWDLAPSTAQREESRALLWPIVGFSVGGLGLTVGSISGLATLRKKSPLRDQCNSAGGCPESARSDIDSAKSSATVADVAFVVGGAALLFGAGALLFGSSSPPPKSSVPSCRGPLAAGSP